MCKVSVSINGGSIVGSAQSPFDLPSKVRADLGTGLSSDPVPSADRSPSRLARFLGGQRLRSAQKSGTTGAEHRGEKSLVVVNEAYRGPGSSPASVAERPYGAVRQQAQDLYARGLLVPQRQASADLLAQRMARPTGLSGWFTGLFKSKLRSFDGLMTSLVAPALAGMPPDMASGLRCSVSTNICGTLVSRSFDALDERGQRRWCHRTTATRGAFASALARLERQCAHEPQGLASPGAQRRRAMRDVMREMREQARTRGSS
jgi:hypothetical protein